MHLQPSFGQYQLDSLVPAWIAIHLILSPSIFQEAIMYILCVMCTGYCRGNIHINRNLLIHWEFVLYTIVDLKWSNEFTRRSRATMQHLWAVIFLFSELWIVACDKQWFHHPTAEQIGIQSIHLSFCHSVPFLFIDVLVPMRKTSDVISISLSPLLIRKKHK